MFYHRDILLCDEYDGQRYSVVFCFVFVVVKLAVESEDCFLQKLPIWILVADNFVKIVSVEMFSLHFLLLWFLLCVRFFLCLYIQQCRLVASVSQREAGGFF